MDFRPFLQAQVDIAFEANRTREPSSWRHKHFAAAGGETGGDGLAERLRVAGSLSRQAFLTLFRKAGLLI
jgi:hypothetical protein